MSQTQIDPVLTQRLAETAVRVGLNLQPGQDLVLTAPVGALPLVRAIAAEAYKAGAGLVTPFLSDDEVTLARYRHGHDLSFDRATGWLYEGMGRAFDEGAARLAVSGGNPMLLAGQNAGNVARANKAMSMAYGPARERITQFAINWAIVAWPDPAWAALVFPDLPADEAVVKLAEAIFRASRVDTPDPVADWTAHNAELAARCDWLNGQRFEALQFKGPGTDLRVGLAEDHFWLGGATRAQNGVVCNPNIPSEEVFTTPHALRVEGVVRATKPLSYQGTLIEEIAVRFEKGAIVEARAKSGEAVLQEVLKTDEGARRLGEVALVPHGSPIAQSGLLFFNTLFDENAASHIALGQCYSTCFKDGATLSGDEIAARGGNRSAIHIDWMIGSGEVDVDGISPSGAVVPVMRAGAWV